MKYSVKMYADIVHVEFEVWSASSEKWEPAFLDVLDIDSLTDEHLKHVNNVAYMCFRDPLGRWLRCKA
jgi:hypothetical protein